MENFYTLTHISISQILVNGHWLSVGNDRWQNLLQQQFEDVLKASGRLVECLYLTGTHGEHYLWFQRFYGEGILMGPFINSTNNDQISRHQTNETLTHSIDSSSDTHSVSLSAQFDYFSRQFKGLLPAVISQPQLSASVQLLLSSIFDQKTANLLRRQLIRILTGLQTTGATSSSMFDKSVSAPTQPNRASYEAETAFYNTIRAGQVDQVIVALQRFSDSGQPGLVVPGNQLRNEKDLAIAATTLATRSAIQGGLFAETAYQISDKTIQMIEAQTKSSDVVGLLMTRMIVFTKAVHEAKQHHYSTDINALTASIYAHRATGITIRELADKQKKSVNYLASRFHDETGRTFTDYQNRFRLEYAQEQLTTTAGSITSIATAMNFDDASYFTKWFKRLCGKTPTQYRQNV